MPVNDSPFFTEDTAGRIHFTDLGLETLKPYFAKAGIRIETITTKAEYYQARRITSDLFLDSLHKQAANGPKTLERQALMAAVGDDSQKFEKLLRKVRQKRDLNLKAT